MIRKIWIVNLILAILLLLVVFGVYRSWNRSSLSVKDIPESIVDDNFKIPRIDRNRMSSGSYDVIEEKNLFSPERAPTVRKVNLEPRKEEAVTEVSTPPFIKQKYMLFGLIIKENEKRALIKAPVQDKDMNPVRWVSVNDKLDDFTVAEITKDKIYIRNNSERYAIPLYKEKEESMPDIPAAIQTTERETPKVISTLSPEEKNTNVTTEEDNEDIVVIDGKKYKIIETPFGKSRIRIN